MSVDVSQYFNTTLPAALNANVAAAQAVGLTFQMNISDASSWNVNASVPSVTPGQAAANVTCTMTTATFETLLQNPEVNGMLLFLQGLIQVVGDPKQARKFMNLMLLVPPPS